MHNQAVIAEMDSEETQQLINEFFKCATAYECCYQLYRLDQQPWDPGRSGPNGNALQAASLKGHGEVVQILLENRADVNAQGGVFGNALQAASFKGYGEVVQILLEKGADINAKGGHLGNALQAASAIGHKEVVQILIETGADVNAQGGYYGSAIGAASNNGHLHIVRTLLIIEPVGTRQSDQPGSKRKRFEDVVGQQAAENSVDLNLRDAFGRTPLFLASKAGNALVVAALFRHHQVDPDPEDRYGPRPLAVAAAHGHVKTVESLLTAPVRVDVQDIFGRTPLSWARKSGSSYIEQLFIKQGDGAAKYAEIVEVLVLTSKTHKAVHRLCDYELHRLMISLRQAPDMLKTLLRVHLSFTALDIYSDTIRLRA
ncbi:ankyrin repeat protein [Diaporthe eres]|nr:ankyrin repeat protein [Diaporthe eres]